MEILKINAPTIDDLRLDAPHMPKPWFRAQGSPWTIGHYVQRKDARLVIPPFQRGLVWTREQSVRFIESIWGGLPLGSYCVNLGIDTPYEDWLLDGQQRWNAIKQYIEGEFPVLGVHFHELQRGDARRFLGKPFDCMQVDIEDEATLREIFERLAYGGTPNVRAEAP